MMIQVIMELKCDFNPLKTKKIKIFKTIVIRKKFNLILMIILVIMVLKWPIKQAREDKNKIL